MQPASLWALGSPEEQEKASQAANFGGSKKWIVHQLHTS
jgi:hypothetical protein